MVEFPAAQLHRVKKKRVCLSVSLSLIHASGLVKKNIYYPMYFNRNLIPRTHTFFYYFSHRFFFSFLPFFFFFSCLPTDTHQMWWNALQTHKREEKTGGPGRRPRVPVAGPLKKKKGKKGGTGKENIRETSLSVLDSPGRPGGRRK